MRYMSMLVVKVAVASFLMQGCGGIYEDQAAYEVSLQNGSNINDTVELMKRNGITEFKARLAYSSHESQVDFKVDEDDISSFVLKERDRLEFLSRQFSPNDAMELPVYERLRQDIESIDTSHTIVVKSAEYVGHPIKGSYVTGFLKRGIRRSGEVASSSQAVVTDWPNDAFWTPAGGTSTIYTTGTLQKFWLDSQAKSVISNYNSGLEMDTIIRGSSNATCSTNGVSSNMPGYYADTEFLDDSGNRNCSVGTIDAGQLQIWTLYWTWHPFGSFNSGANPYITIMYQAKSWCSWIPTYTVCANNKDWCMCNMSSYPTQWLVSYNYADRPGQETGWTKN